MTNSFELRFEWIDAIGVQEEALARTFARLEVLVDGSCVTRAFDSRLGTVVEGTYVSLLPIAAWVVDCWWTACVEAPRTEVIRSVREARPPSELAWHRRHGWLSSREGFCLPELVVSRSDVGTVRLDWFREPYTHGTSEAMPLRFLDDGNAHVPLDILRDQFGRVVEATLARCEGLVTPVIQAIRDRWSLLTSASAHERHACERTARLGLDAYDPAEVDEELADLLGREDLGLDESILSDTLDAADDVRASRLNEQIEQFSSVMRARSPQASEHWGNVTTFRDRMLRVAGLPYERGYERARLLRRDVLGLSENVVAAALDQAIEATVLPADAVQERDEVFKLGGIHALAASTDSSPLVVMRSRSVAGRRFDLARALHMLVSSHQPRLINVSFDAEQRASRAFAAELLAPVGYLRGRIDSRFVDQDDLEQLGREIGVSSLVIRHQIENQDLAVLVDA